jgi:hypothetical protein
MLLCSVRDWDRETAMNGANFRDFVFPHDHPRNTRLQGFDAHTHAANLLDHPFVRDLFQRWEELYLRPFVGITSDGTVRRDLYALAPNGSPTGIMVEAADLLLRHISAAERSALCFPIDANEWRRWNNTEIYAHRYGLRLEEVSLTVRDQILHVVRSSMSDSGYQKTRDVMRLNEFLGDLVGAPRILGEYSFNFTLFGAPSAVEPWGWQLYGHHLAINCFVRGAQLVISPTFMGAEPNYADSGPFAGTYLFRDEECMGLEMMRSLPRRMRDKAQVYRMLGDPAMPPGRWHQADQQHLGGAFQDNRLIPYEGAHVSAFSRSQRNRLLDLVSAYLAPLPAGPLGARLQEIERHLDDTHFCWIGPWDDDSPFYYRIQSPVILTEFDNHSGVFLSNEEPKRFHVHTLVRTPNGNDYGADILRLHYAKEHGPGHSHGRR